MRVKQHYHKFIIDYHTFLIYSLSSSQEKIDLCPWDDLYTLYPSEADGKKVFLDPHSARRTRKRQTSNLSWSKLIQFCSSHKKAFGLGLNLVSDKRTSYHVCMKRSKIPCSLVQELTSHFQGVFYGWLCRKIAWPVRFVMEVKHSLECFSSRYIGDATTHLRPGWANAVLSQTLNFTWSGHKANKREQRILLISFRLGASEIQRLI